MTKTPEELTEEWKAGKLDWNKFYYIKLTSGEICIDYAHGAYFIKGKPQEITMDYTTNNDVKQILAPVPTYDEYKAMWDQIADASKKVEELELNNKILEKCQEQDFGVSYLVTVKTQIENNNLRGLLKECKNIVAHDCWQEAQFPDGQVVERQDLLTRINAAIGESED